MERLGVVQTVGGTKRMQGTQETWGRWPAWGLSPRLMAGVLGAATLWLAWPAAQGMAADQRAGSSSSPAHPVQAFAGELDAPPPYYSDAVFVMALAGHHHRPLASAFRQQADALKEATAALCPAGGALPVVTSAVVPNASTAQEAAQTVPPALKAARETWLSAADGWTRLEAVSVGPIITRRSAKAIDFRPTRPKLILKMLERLDKGASVPDVEGMKRVGSATKGLAAIEWLLWSPQAPASVSACRYLVAMVDEVADEAAALASAYAADAAVDWVAASEDDGQPVAVEGTESAAQRAAMVVNQWLGGLEGLRWRTLGKPLAVIEIASGEKASDPHRDIWPRPPSASNRQAWQARWESLKQVGVGQPPTDGSGPQPDRVPAVISLEALLRGLGKETVADAWREAMRLADEAMQAVVAPQDEHALPPVATMKRAVSALDRVKWLMQDKVAPALSVTLGFSDADGD
ncbi:MAG: imelysin family protein [Lautropia sp.]|nr:imelysin family protein [Lautropia sp.]